MASGYIMPRHFGTFVFRSSTAPPKTMPFDCGFYDCDHTFGGFDFCGGGTAYLVDRNDPNMVEAVPAVGIYDPSWDIRTMGGVLPDPDPPVWLPAVEAALVLARSANRVSPQQRANILELASEYTSIASAAIKEEIKTLQKK
jgi:hypothetical protein